MEHLFSEPMVACGNHRGLRKLVFHETPLVLCLKQHITAHMLYFFIIQRRESFNQSEASIRIFVSGCTKPLVLSKCSHFSHKYSALHTLVHKQFNGPEQLLAFSCKCSAPCTLVHKQFNAVSLHAELLWALCEQFVSTLRALCEHFTSSLQALYEHFVSSFSVSCCIKEI